MTSNEEIILQAYNKFKKSYLRYIAIATSSTDLEYIALILAVEDQDINQAYIDIPDDYFNGIRLVFVHKSHFVQRFQKEYDL